MRSFRAMNPAQPHHSSWRKQNITLSLTDPFTAKGAKSVLRHLAQSQAQRKTARALEPCAQLEFQSTV